MQVHTIAVNVLDLHHWHWLLPHFFTLEPPEIIFRTPLIFKTIIKIFVIPPPRLFHFSRMSSRQDFLPCLLPSVCSKFKGDPLWFIQHQRWDGHSTRIHIKTQIVKCPRDMEFRILRVYTGGIAGRVLLVSGGLFRQISDLSRTDSLFPTHLSSSMDPVILEDPISS